MRRAVILVLVLAVFPAANPARAVPAASETEATLYRLASNNGAFEASGSPQWVLRVDDGRYLAVSGDPLMRSGTRVRLPASELRKSSVRASSVKRASLLSAPLAAAKLVPNRSLAIVPLQWGGSTWTEVDTTTTQSIIATLVPWWNRMSARQETLNVTVAPVIDANASFPTVDNCLSIDRMFSDALDHLEKSGLGLEFNHVMVLFPGLAPSCGWAGLASLGGGATWTYAIPGYGGVWTHELGHNLGFTHGNLCTSKFTVTYVENCVDEEYGNSMDIMGSYPNDSMDAAYFAPGFLRAARWLPDGNMATWSGEAVTYTLQRADRSDLGTTAISLPAFDPAVGDNSFWLQYNPTPSVARSTKTSGQNGGVVLTMAPSDQFAKMRIASDDKTLAGYASADSYLCNLAPGSDGPWSADPRLLPGMSYTDPRNRFSITLLAVDGTSAQVRVEPVTNAVVPPATVEAALDSTGRRQARVAVGGQTPGANEPTLYVVDTLEDPARSCTFTAFESACIVPGLARNANYTFRVSGTNGSARSSPVLSQPVFSPVVPPTFDVSFTTLSNSIVARVTVDDGGSPLTSQPSLELPGKPACALSGGTGTLCTFTGLNPRSTYVLTARGANSIGPRELEYAIRTTVAIPQAPTVKATYDGKDVLVSATAARVDALNATHLDFGCVHGAKWSDDKLPMDPVSRSATFRLASARGKYVACWVKAIASDDDEDGGYESSGATYVVRAAKGKFLVTRVALKVSVTSTKPGTVLVKWSTKGSTGRPVVSVSPARKKRCVRVTAQSCMVKGLKSGTDFTVAFSAKDGPASSKDERTVVVK
ncbi:MAG: hypothetical protein ACKOFF_05895 [Acidimicrobiales bacterium]